MFVRNRMTGQVHEVPDHMVQGFHLAQEVDGFGDPLGLPFLAALLPALTNILPAIGGLFKGGGESAAPPPPPAPVVAPPPMPPPRMEPPEEPLPRRRMAPTPDEDVALPRPDGAASAPAAGAVRRVIFRKPRRGRRRVRRMPPPQVNGYGWWY